MTSRLHAGSSLSPDKAVPQGSCTTVHREKSLRSKVLELSRELATLTQERDILMENVLGNSAANNAPLQELVQRIITESQERWLDSKQELPSPNKPLRGVSPGMLS